MRRRTFVGGVFTGLAATALAAKPPSLRLEIFRGGRLARPVKNSR